MITPLNMPLVYSSLANAGNIMTPRLIIDDGTAIAARIPDVNLAPKTGTAEIKTSQDDENGTENAWFVAVDTTGSRISISMIIEDVKGRGGSNIPIPNVKNIIEDYINR